MCMVCVKMQPIVKLVTVGDHAKTVVNDSNSVVFANPRPSSFTVDPFRTEHSLPSRKISNVSHETGRYGGCNRHFQCLRCLRGRNPNFKFQVLALQFDTKSAPIIPEYKVRKVDLICPFGSFAGQ